MIKKMLSPLFNQWLNKVWSVETDHGLSRDLYQ